MARKNNDNNPLQIKVRVNSLPKSVSPKRFLQRLMEHIKDDRPLPSLWDVEVGWRNPGTKYGLTKKWRYDDFESAVSDSREGFNALLYSALAQRLLRLRIQK
jgi:hypothetical protein